MNTITNTYECLSFELLQKYCNNQLNIIEKQKIYHHLNSCELCSSAVNGFTFIPFNQFEIDAINDSIDAKINYWDKIVSTIKYSSIALLSILSIISLYIFASSFKYDKKVTNNTKPGIVITQHASNFLMKNNEPNSTHIIKNNLLKKVVKQEKQLTLTPETLKSKAVALAKSKMELEERIKIRNKSSDIYIYDLKVSRFEELYLKQNDETILFSKHLPAYKEDTTSIAPDELIEKETFSSIELLKNGLFYFNKSDYENALGYFNQLLVNNSKDINAIFYSALCYYNINKPTKAIEQLEELIQYKNSFHEEVKWNLALSYLKVNNVENAKALLLEIISEKGFYTEKAKMKLNEL